MKSSYLLLLLALLVACGKQKPSQIIGSWCECQKDGTYKEYKITEHYSTTSVSNFQEHDWDNGISFFEIKIQDSLLIATKGINVDLMHSPETLRFEGITNNLVTLKSRFGTSQLIRLKNEIPDIDSSNMELWTELYLDSFLDRARLADCPDLRTEEEKDTSMIHLGVVEDDFEELVEIDTLSVTHKN